MEYQHILRIIVFIRVPLHLKRTVRAHGYNLKKGARLFARRARPTSRLEAAESRDEKVRDYPWELIPQKHEPQLSARVTLVQITFDSVNYSIRGDVKRQISP